MNQCTRGMLAVAGKVIASWAITPVVQTYLNITQTTSFMKPIKELRKLEGRPKVTMFQKSQGKLSTGNGKHSITKFMLWCVIGTVVEVPLGTCAFQVYSDASLLVFTLGRQQMMAQVFGLLPSMWETGQCSRFLGLAWSSLGYHRHLRSEATDGSFLSFSFQNKVFSPCGWKDLDLLSHCLPL